MAKNDAGLGHTSDSKTVAVPTRSQPAPERGGNVWDGYSKVQSDQDPSKVSKPSKLPAC